MLPYFYCDGTLMTTKTWIISDGIYSVSDVEFLTDIEVKFKIIPPVTTYLDCGSVSAEIVIRRSEIHITTSCEKQELMLKLRWGDRVYFLSQSDYQKLSELRKIQNETMGQ